MRIGPYEIGTGRCLVIAELGANANGDLQTAIQMIDAAKAAGADLVKFQKRLPSVCIPIEQQSVMKETPRGPMTYLAYREWLEFGHDEYDAIDRHCRSIGLPWFASPWDLPSVEFLRAYDLPAVKIASASLTDHALLRAARDMGKPVILSTGMSTLDAIDAAAPATPTGENAGAVTAAHRYGFTETT